MKRLAVLLLLLAAAGCRDAEPRLREGDMVFQTSTSRQSRLIQLATGSPYSHMGVVFAEDGRLYVLEAVQPVKFTPLKQWIARGESRRYTVRRLKNAERLLTPAAVAELKRAGRRHLGKNYDSLFHWSDERMYCSELVWKMYRETLGIELGQPQRLRELDLSHPAVRAGLQERFGRTAPLDELIITPERIFRSEMLETVGKVQLRRP